MEGEAKQKAMIRVLDYNVDLVDEVGRGSFGTIYKGIHERTSEVVAVKRVSKKVKAGAISESVRSLYLKKEIVHDHIVRVFQVQQFQDSMWIFMEYCHLGDLGDFFQNHQNVVKETETKARLMRQIACGIDFLHTNRVVHRDIKPANILVQLSSGNAAVVKLGDFGLSKILDPDDTTSTMSSNVGTFTFKAPEFWNKEPPKGHLTYHRNIDVYAAGLTFAAMLQFQPGKRLVPKPQGSAVQPSEVQMPIGLMAHNRTLNKHPDVTVVQHKETDCFMMKKVKALIQGMTHVSSDSRLSASAVRSILEILTNKTDLTFKFKTAEVDFQVDMVCFANDRLILRGKDLSTNPRSFKAYDSETGDLKEEWGAECPHYIECGSLVACTIPTRNDRQDLIEGCKDCGLIRVYNLDTQEVATLLENIVPLKLCNGPDDTILVWEGRSKMIQQLISKRKKTPDSPQPETPDWQLVPRLGPFDCHLLAICYAKRCDIVILLSFIGKLTTLKARGINLTTGRVVWSDSRSLQDAPLNPEDICSTKEGLVTVMHGNSLFSLDPVDGITMETILQNEELNGISEVSCSNQGEELKMALRHGSYNGAITCYGVNLKCDPVIVQEM